MLLRGSNGKPNRSLVAPKAVVECAEGMLPAIFFPSKGGMKRDKPVSSRRSNHRKRGVQEETFKHKTLVVLRRRSLAVKAQSFQKCRIILLLTMFLLVTLLVSSINADMDLEVEAMQYVTRQYGSAAGNLLASKPEFFHLPVTEVSFSLVKVIDTGNEKSYGIAFDSFGNVVDPSSLRAAEVVARWERYGPLDPGLYDRLLVMADDESITVAIWLKMDDPQLESPPPVSRGLGIPQQAVPGAGDDSTPCCQAEIEKGRDAVSVEENQVDSRLAEWQAANEQRRAAAVGQLASQVSAVQESLLQALAARGITPTYVSPIAPLVYAELLKSEVQELASRPDVDAIYGPSENESDLDTAKPTHKADIVDDTFWYDGDGVDVAIHERGRIAFNNPNLNTGITRDTSGGIEWHSTFSAGIVASQHATDQGIAQGADLFSANATTYYDTDLSAAMDWAAVTQNVDIINMSWGSIDDSTTLNEHDRHVDWIVRNLWSTIVIAAGNDAGTCNNQDDTVDNPGRAFNAITVGAFDDHNTLTWDDDDMWECSDFEDPSTGADKPEVVASGVAIDSTTDSSPWIATASGTSFSSPMVAGQAALMMEIHSAFETRPEMVKAAIMATALNNIEGGSRLSDLDGAGGIDIRASSFIAHYGPWDFRVVTENDLPYEVTALVYAGETVRAAIAWDSNPSSDYSNDPLEADIDLRVLDPDDQQVASSTSGSNPFEIVEFTANSTGIYTFRVYEFSFSGTSEKIGFAAWVGERVLSHNQTQYWPAPPRVRDVYSAGTGTYAWQAVGIRQDVGSDFDLRLYAGSPFADPEDHDLLASSTYGASSVDYVIWDRNHAPATKFFPEVQAFSGNGNYFVEYNDTAASFTRGTKGTYSMAHNEVLHNWDILLTNGVYKAFSVAPSQGSADLGLALHVSNSTNSSTWYQSRSQAIAHADAAGGGSRECLGYTPSDTDWAGLVVYNKGYEYADYNLYVDDSAPSGSVSINGGAASTTSQNVTINLSLADNHTGVWRIRFRNQGGNWSAWQSYTSTKAWTLTPGYGSKTVEVQAENNACMSKTYSDTIEYIDVPWRIHLPLVLNNH